MFGRNWSDRLGNGAFFSENLYSKKNRFHPSPIKFRRDKKNSSPIVMTRSIVDYETEKHISPEKSSSKALA